jgi:hypothetical protein
MIEEIIIHYKHIAGDGRHFVTPYGSLSDIAILSNLQVLAIFHGLPGVDKLWTEAYPDDPMEFAELAKITVAGVDSSEYFDAEPLDSILSLLEDLKNIGCEKLAEIVIRHLEEAGIISP